MEFKKGGAIDFCLVGRGGGATDFSFSKRGGYRFFSNFSSTFPCSPLPVISVLSIKLLMVLAYLSTQAA